MNSDYQNEDERTETNEQNLRNSQRIDAIQRYRQQQEEMRQRAISGSRQYSLNSNDDSMLNPEPLLNPNHNNQVYDERGDAEERGYEDPRFAPKEIVNPYGDYLNIPKQIIKTSRIHKIQTIFNKIIGNIPFTQTLHLPFQFNGSYSYVGGNASFFYLILYAILGFMSYKIIKGNFNVQKVDTIDNFIDQSNYTSNSQLAALYQDINLVPQFSLPFESLFFQNNVIECSQYNSLSISEKIVHGYMSFTVMRDISQNVSVQIPFECEQISNQEVKMFINEKIGEWIFKLYDKEYKNNNSADATLDKNIADLYSIPIDAKSIQNNFYQHFTGFRKYCDGKSVIRRQLTQQKRHFSQSIQEIGDYTKNLDICDALYKYDQNLHFVKDIYVPDQNSSEKDITFDYYVNNSDLNNSKINIFYPNWQEFTTTNLTFESNILNYYKKDIAQITDSVTFDYWQALYQLVIYNVVLLGIFGILMKFMLPCLFKKDLANRIAEMEIQQDTSIMSLTQQAALKKLKLEQISKSFSTLSFEDIYQIIDKLERKTNENLRLNKDIQMLNTQLQELMGQYNQLNNGMNQFQYYNEQQS